jgi:DNA-binding CsgD family transcriptional regulator
VTPRFSFTLPEEHPPLTKRQAQALAAAVNEANEAKAAALLGISPDTLRTYLQQAYQRLGANSRAHAAYLAYPTIGHLFTLRSPRITGFRRAA